MARENSGKNQDRREKSPIEIFARAEGSPPRSDGDKWQVGGLCGKSAPRFSQLPAAFGVDRKRTEDGHNQERTEENDRSFVSVGNEVKRRPDRNAP
jgi:hypothetical protein